MHMKYFCSYELFGVPFGAIYNLICVSAFDKICPNSLFRFVCMYLLDKIPPPHHLHKSMCVQIYSTQFELLDP